MKTYTQEEIDKLIACKKVIVAPPKREMKLVNGSKRNGMKLKSKDGEAEFNVFIRINDRFTENFSIGLTYLPREDEGLCLFRCNGAHGEHRNHDNSLIQNIAHIHKATENAINTGRRAESYAELTDKYFNYEGALIYFIKEANIEGVDKYFPLHKQLELFEYLKDRNKN